MTAKHMPQVWSRLTRREMQVLRCRLSLMDNEATANALRIKQSTVRWYLGEARLKVPTARTVDDLLILAERSGVQPIEAQFGDV